MNHRSFFRNADHDLVSFLVDMQGKDIEHHLTRKHNEAKLEENKLHVVFTHEPGKYRLQALFGPENKGVNASYKTNEPSICIIHPFTQAIMNNPIEFLLTGIMRRLRANINLYELGTREGYTAAIEYLKDHAENWHKPGIFEMAAQLKDRRNKLPSNQKTIEMNKYL